MLDEYVTGSSNRLSPEAPVPVVLKSNSRFHLGGCGNVCNNLKSLGASVKLISIIGNDDSGKHILKLCKSNGINHKLLKKSYFKTPHKQRIVVENNQLIRVDNEDSMINLNRNDKNKIMKHLKEWISSVDIIIFSDYNKGISFIAQETIKIAKKNKKTIIIDPKSSDLNLYKGADLITPNLNEYESIVGKCNGHDEITKKGLSLLSIYQFQNILVTRGKDGMSLLAKNRKRSFEIKASKKDVFDVTGAGDTVIATIAFFQALGSDLYQSVTLSNVAAGIVVSKQGTSNCTLEEIYNEANNPEILTNLSNSSFENQSLSYIFQQKLIGKKIVFTNGCFDILHAGHVKLFQEAKSNGDILVVGINSDLSVKNIKGDSRPINTLEDRIKILSSIKFIDHIISFSQRTPLSLIKKIRPDVLIKGSDYKKNEIVGSNFVIKNGGKVKTVKLLSNKSTSNLIKKINKEK